MGNCYYVELLNPGIWFQRRIGRELNSKRVNDRSGRDWRDLTSPVPIFPESDLPEVSPLVRPEQ